MKVNVAIICGITLLVSACSQSGGISHSSSLNSKQDSISYALGMDIANSVKGGLIDQGLEVQESLIAQAIVDVIGENSLLLQQGDVQGLIVQMQRELSASQQEKMMQKAESNKTEADAFFAENKTKEGVIETESGLQYKILESGKGVSPKADETVVVHYTGKLLDGTTFDSSIERGSPTEFKVNQVISGWTEALQLMVPGDKWEVYIPSNLGYGAAGSPPQIGPYAGLVFEVELIEVK